jgi:SAM-dependent methyltransferase
MIGGRMGNERDQRWVRTVLRYVTPPAVWAAAARLRGGAAHCEKLARPPCTPAEGLGFERDAEWYDENFPESMRQHYAMSRYLCLWAVIVDRMLRRGSRSVLDIGCGAGQFAALLRDKGIREYCGLDFSGRRIEHARSLCPEFTFVVADALETNLYSAHAYDTVCCTEFLEHVEGDIEILSRIRREAVFYGSVPNFPSASHVRYFVDSDQVNTRYSALLDPLRVDPFRVGNHTFFVIEGVKT